MRWFKHFHNARRSEKVGMILETMGVKGYGQWFIILEILTEKISSVENYSKDSIIRVRKRELRESLEVQRNTQVTKILKSLATCNVLCFEQDNFFVSIQCPILFELQDKDSKYNRKRVVKASQGTTLEKNRIEKKRKEKNIYSRESKVEIDPFLFNNVQQSWNMICPGNGNLKEARAFSTDTQHTFIKIIVENPVFSKLDTWKECFETVTKNHRLRGTEDGQKWVCSLRWLIDEQKIINVLNGEYPRNTDAPPVPKNSSSRNEPPRSKYAT